MIILNPSGKIPNVVGLPGGIGLGACHQRGRLTCFLDKGKIGSNDLRTSGHRLLQQLLEYNVILEIRSVARSQ